MSFDYDKIASKSEHASWWTSYADLFMMLSIVFLLMYVASNLRSGTAGFQQQAENKRLTQKSQDLEEQIKVYNTLKDEALHKQADAAEQETYQKLMDRLNLLQDEAHGEKLALEKKAKENGEKEFALNQYQQLIRNIINANVLAKTQIERRDQIIVSKDATIEEKRVKMDQMETVIAKNQTQIANITAQRDEEIKALISEQQLSQSSQQDLQKKIENLRQKTQNEINTLQTTNQSIDLQLGQVRNTLTATESKLGEANQTIEQKEQEKTALATKLEAQKGSYIAQMNALQADQAAKLAAERAAFDQNLQEQQLGADAKAAKLAQFLAQEKAKSGDIEDKLNGLRGKIADTEKELAGTQAQLHGTEAKLAGTQEKLAGTEAEKSQALAKVEDLKGDLARTQAIANARRNLAKQLTDQFAKAGLKGAVDAKTGEVTLDFGGEYFDTGSTQLKPGMQSTLNKFIPVYAKSLFADPKVSDKIANIEVVGFASSTYKGQYVNPKSVRPEDKEAIDYNLRLSFGRANSIFKHVLNQGELSDADRNRLLPIMKVVGRGYLPDGAGADQIPSGMTEQQFCLKFNCKQAQKVVIKFNMKD